MGQQKITTTTVITKKRHLPGGESFEGSGGQHPDPEAISLPVGRRQFRPRLWFFGRREIVVVIVIVVVVVVVVVKLRFFHIAVANVMYEKLIVSELLFIISIYIHSTYE